MLQIETRRRLIMRLEDTDFSDVKIIHPEIIPDLRGNFAEIYDKSAFAELGIEIEFVQDAWSSSIKAGTIRGLHFQSQPHAQAKLVRVTSGKIFDVIVDIRPLKSSFGNHICLELDATTQSSVFIPAGFAHGFCSLTDNTQISYKMSDHFSPPNYRGIRWNDPELKIEWPIDPSSAIISEKDAALPLLRNAIK